MTTATNQTPRVSTSGQLMYGVDPKPLSWQRRPLDWLSPPPARSYPVTQRVSGMGAYVPTAYETGGLQVLVGAIAGGVIGWQEKDNRIQGAIVGMIAGAFIGLAAGG